MRLFIVRYFHQPVYKDPTNDENALPWVNLHSTKNYHQMGELIPGFRRLKGDGVIEVTTSPCYHPLLPAVMVLDGENPWEFYKDEFDLLFRSYLHQAILNAKPGPPS